MADNYQNDEYKFVELDALDNDTMGDMESGTKENSSSFGKEPVPKKNVNRNALVAVVIIVTLMMAYKLFGYLYFATKEKPVPVKNNPPPITQVTPPPIDTTPTIVTTVPTQTIQPTVTVNNSDLTRKVSAIEISQQSVRSEVSSVSQQVGSVNSNINNLNNQIANLNQVIGNLSNQMAKQSEEINVLMSRSQPKRVIKPVHQAIIKPIVYYLQAVIPGRAWLIGTNGSTLTVREGTKIAGYGMVKLIDSIQGRVVTSSGQVIRFSQEDS